MAPTKDELEAENAQLREELDRTRGQLTEARAGLGGVQRVTFPTSPGFQLSEGVRQDLEQQGVARDPNTGAELLASDFDVEVRTAAGKLNLEQAQRRRDQAGGRDEGIRGVDYVYPSVAPGVLAADAPVRGAVADTTRIEGVDDDPAADADLADADQDQQ